MRIFPGHFLRQTFTRLFQRLDILENSNQDGANNNNFVSMTSPELETAGLQDKTSPLNTPTLPDATKQIQLGSGVTTGILGEGGSSIIYEIKNSKLGLQRAVKILKPQYTRDAYNRFLREFCISLQLNHPHLVVVHTLGQWNKLPFIEMEKVSGFPLSTIIAQFSPLPTGLVSALGIILCRTLSFLHNSSLTLNESSFHGLLHLDLKPSNIILSDLGVLKIMDFGLAAPAEGGKHDQYPQKGVGSIQYIAPEILLESDTPDVRSDIFSFGCIMYELLSGAKAFPGSDEESIMYLRNTNTYIPLKKVIKSVPHQMSSLIDKCLSGNKDMRPSDITEIIHTLETIHYNTTTFSPENTIEHYSNCRHNNVPFSVPTPPPKAATVFCRFGIVLSIICLIFISFLYIIEKDTISKIPFISTLSFKTDTIRTRLPIHLTPSFRPPFRKSVQENGFYAPELPPVQVALLDSIRTCWEIKKFDRMRSLISRLDPVLSRSKEIQLYKMRSLSYNISALGTLLSEIQFSDGEYFFHKARFQFGQKEYTDALMSLQNALSFPCEFLDKPVLVKEVQLYKSRCLTSMFRADPTSENLKNALDSWDSLLTIFKNNNTSNGIHATEAKKEKKNLVAEASWRGL